MFRGRHSGEGINARQNNFDKGAIFMKKTKWLSILTLIWASSAYAGQTGYFYKVQRDDPNGNSTEVFYTDVQRTFSIHSQLGAYPDESSVTIRITPTPDFSNRFQPEPWLGFSAPEGAALAVGSYPNATSDDSLTQPGLSLSTSTVENCPGATGSFEVREIVFDSSTHLATRFAADFVYRCESTTSTTYGSVRYNSDVPFPQGVPVAIESNTPLNSAGCFETSSMAGRNVDFHVVNGTTSQTYEWSAKVEGRPTASSCPFFMGCPPSVLRTLEGTGKAFAFDLAPVNSEQAKVVLTATDMQTGEVQQARLTACVSDSTPPTITIRRLAKERTLWEIAFSWT